MKEKKTDPVQYLLVDTSVLPDVFMRIVDAKRLLSTGRTKTVNEAVKLCGVSRSVFYKYKDSVYSFLEMQQGRIITFSVQLEDKPGVLSAILLILAECKANVLTINQNIPVDGLAPVSLTVQTNGAAENIGEIFKRINQTPGVKRVDMLAGGF